MSEDRPQDPNQPPPSGPPSGSSPYDQPTPWSAPPPPPPAQPPYSPEPYSPQPSGQTQPSGQPQPYGQPPYGGPAPAYGTGYGPTPASAQARSSATLWLILNIVTVVFCSNLPGIVGAIYAGLALGRADTDPADAQRKVRLSKIWFFAGLILAAVVLIGGLIALVAYGRFGNSGGSYSPSGA